MGGRTEAEPGAAPAAMFTFTELRPAESELAAGREEMVTAAGGGVEEFGLSPAEGDSALMSSTGLFYKQNKED